MALGGGFQPGGIAVPGPAGPPGRAREISERVERARHWLRTAVPATAEDRSMQLLGLHWAGGADDILHSLARAISAEQQPDGGWRPRPGLPSDAYATGESLYALAASRQSSAADPAYRKGFQFLLRTQRPDGTWFVPGRSPRIQAYFEGGFPYSRDQWISSWATAWAVMALAEGIETPVKRAAE